MRHLALLVYNLLMPVVLLLMLPAQWLKMRRRGGYTERAGERFARYLPETLARLRPSCWWVHAVSVGEILMALKLIAELRQSGVWTGPIALTTTTSTGRRLAIERADAATTVLWTPLDLPWIAESALEAIAPQQIVLVEAEVWPNLLVKARRRGIPTRIVNARLSSRSEARYRRIRGIVGPIFSQLDHVCVQEEADVVRFQALGIDRQNISVTGAIKYDDAHDTGPITGLADAQQLCRELPALSNKALLLAASTHPGEEVLIAKAWMHLRKEFPDLALVLVPRHFERAAELADALVQLGLHPVLRTKFTHHERVLEVQHAERADCLIVNTTGELRAWYALSTLVVVGKSFGIQHGGQNPAEPVRAGRPTITGPNMGNFKSLMEALTRAEGIRQLQHDDELEAALRALLSNPAAATGMAQRGAKVLDKHQGATRRCVALLAMASALK